ncbi:hypothetical protein Vafri_8249 [Volvox africanus]|nr:hypothetical protein Vafri_8249 [Volvox africanus]
MCTADAGASSIGGHASELAADRTCTAASARSLSLHASTTCAPRLASCCAVAKPIPALPPVTMATCGPSRGDCDFVSSKVNLTMFQFSFYMSASRSHLRTGPS